MAVSVVMPALEMAQETGKLVSWKKKEGEQVKKGEMLLEVETDKAVVEIEAGGDGVLSGVTAKVGDVVPVGQTIAWLLKPGEAVPTGGAQSQSGRKMESAPAATAAAAAPAAPEPASVAGAKISPKARRLAREHGVDIARLRGSGPGGEILADDILKAAQAATRTSGSSRAGCAIHSDSGSSSCCAAATSGHGPSGRRHLDRPHHGRTDDAELDDGPAFLRRSRRRRHGPERDA